jgi:uncharacterized protein (DUF58 family)
MVLVLLVTAVVFGRVDLAVLAAPFVLGTGAGLAFRPTRLPQVGTSTDQAHLVEGHDLGLQLAITNGGDESYGLAVVRRSVADLGSWLAADDAHRPLGVAVRAGTQARLGTGGRILRWGRHTYPPLSVHVVAADGLLESAPVVSPPLALKVFPRTDPFEAEDAMPNAAGLVGAHRSRRYGDGGELAGIRRFGPGDRLRRIDWRTSLRTGELHITQTLSDRDAELVLVLDVLHEAGVSGGVDGAASTTDTTVRAAAGIAQHYVGRGDRVRMLEYGGRNRALRAGTGRRHYQVALEWLLAVQPGEGPHDPTEGIFHRHVIPTAALLVVLTPLVDRRSIALLARLARSGRSVVAVDTLPAHARPPRTGQWSDVAYRLWRLERRNTLAQLLEHGVPTVAWSGAGSLDQVLRDVSRIAAAPR